MSAPHADRDHSEQPCCGDHNHEPCRGCPDGRDAGTSRPVSAREVRASEAQQVAAMDALDCGAYQNRRGVVVCVNEHHEHYGAWSERGCPVAAAVADAVVAAGPDADEVTRLRAEVERLNESAGVVWADMNEAINAASDRAEKAEAEVAQLRRTVDIQDRLLGSHTDGHRCTCTMVDRGVYHGDNMHPPEWEQDPWCPTHPDADYIRQRFEKAEAERERLRRAWDTHDTDCAAVEAERDRLAEVVARVREELAIQTAQTQAAATKVARVEALAKHITEGHRELPLPHGPWTRGYATAIRNVLRALSGPSPAHTPATATEPAPRAAGDAEGQSGEGEALRGAEKGEEAGR